jgi:hypothetical protein
VLLLSALHNAPNKVIGKPAILFRGVLTGYRFHPVVVLQVLAALLNGASGVMKVFMFDEVSEGGPSLKRVPREAWKGFGSLELVCTVG